MDIPAIEPLDPTSQLVANTRALLRSLREGSRSYTVSPDGAARVLVEQDNTDPPGQHVVLRLLDADQPAEVEAATFGPRLLADLCDAVEAAKEVLALERRNATRAGRSFQEGVEFERAAQKRSALTSLAFSGAEALRSVVGLASMLIPWDAEEKERRAIVAVAQLCVARYRESALRLIGEVVEDPTQPLAFAYVNWEGRYDANRRAFGFHSLRWGTTEHHQTPGWLVSAQCMHKHAQRDFALSGMSNVRKLVKDGAGDWTDPRKTDAPGAP